MKATPTNTRTADPPSHKRVMAKQLAGVRAAVQSQNQLAWACISPRDEEHPRNAGVFGSPANAQGGRLPYYSTSRHPGTNGKKSPRRRPSPSTRA